MAADGPAVLDDVERELRGSDLGPGYPGRQTRANLQDLNRGPWPRFFDALVAVCDGIVASEPGRHAPPDAAIRGIRSWALELEAPYDLGSTRHSHAGWTFSSVLWVELPENDAAAGTTFHDPVGFVQPAQSAATRHDVAAAAWDLLVFPWWVEHNPSPVTRSTGRRVIISSDLVYR